MTDREAEDAQAYIDTVAAAVRLRLEAGNDPRDAMLTGWDLMNAWVAVHVDGSAEAVYHVRHKAT